MAKVLTKALLVLAVAALPFSALARTQENAVWSAESAGDMTSLRYGAFDQDLPLMQLTCFNELEIAVLDIYDDVGTAKPGDPVEIELAVGSISAPLKGEAAEQVESAEVYAEVSDFPIKPVINVFRAEGPLTVKIGETTRTFEGVGRDEALKTFTETCELD